MASNTTNFPSRRREHDMNINPTTKEILVKVITEAIRIVGSILSNRVPQNNEGKKEQNKS